MPCPFVKIGAFRDVVLGIGFQIVFKQRNLLPSNKPIVMYTNRWNRKSLLISVPTNDDTFGAQIVAASIYLPAPEWHHQHESAAGHRDARHSRGVRLLAGSVVLVVVAAAAAAAAVAPLNVYLTVWHRLQALGRDSCGDFFRIVIIIRILSCRRWL